MSNLIAITGSFAGRAGGGPVSSGAMYEVNERGPEILNQGGRDYLMMGGQGGSITPLSAQPAAQSSSSPAVINHYSITVPVQAMQGVSRATALQQGAAYGEGIQRALARNR